MNKIRNILSKSDLLNLRNKNLTNQQIADKLDVPVEWLRKQLRTNGLTNQRFNNVAPSIRRPSREELKEFRKTHSIEQACEHFGVARTTIKRWCEAYNLFDLECKHEIKNVRHPREIIPSRDELKLIRMTRTLDETAGHFNVFVSTIEKWSAKYDLTSHECKYGCPLVLPDEFTQEQLDFLTGSLLGDGCVPNRKKQTHNTCYSLTLKRGSREYVEMAQSILSPFSLMNIHDGKSKKPVRINGKINWDAEHWIGEWCYYSALHTHCHPLFTALRKKWYPNGKKIIPADISLNWKIIAYWMCEDGCNQPKRQSIKLSTNAFSINDVSMLSGQLISKFGIVSTITMSENKPVLYIKSSSYLDFINGITQYVSCDCMKYKIRTL